MLGVNPARLDTIRAGALTEYINQHVRFGWHWDFWPEWLLTQARYYRAAWSSATSYAAPAVGAPVEAFYFPARKYYQSLVAANLNNAPSTLTGGVYVENSAFWAECLSSYTTTLWTANTAYAVGAKVERPEDGQPYQCTVAHTSGASFDATKFGLLTPFNRYVDYEQTGQTVISRVKGVSTRSPLVFPTKYGPLAFSKSDAGVQVGPDAPEVVWVQFQAIPPVFTSTPWAASTGYAVGDLVYNGGETYRCTTGHISTSTFDSTKFTLVEFPFLLGDYVKRCAKAGSLEDLKLTNRAMVNEERAGRMLADLWDDEFPGQQQSDTARVVTYS